MLVSEGIERNNRWELLVQDFSGQMPLLPPNQQCQIANEIITGTYYKYITFYVKSAPSSQLKA